MIKFIQLDKAEQFLLVFIFFILVCLKLIILFLFNCTSMVHNYVTWSSQSSSFFLRRARAPLRKFVKGKAFQQMMRVIPGQGNFGKKKKVDRSSVVFNF